MFFRCTTIVVLLLSTADMTTGNEAAAHLDLETGDSPALMGVDGAAILISLILSTLPTPKTPPMNRSSAGGKPPSCLMLRDVSAT
ncbi:hypothetical protein MIMGU_mgv11b015479mg, partial [Erythranthe guttata]